MSAGRRRVRLDARGLTLIEVLVAVSSLAVVVLLLTGALRVGLRAWEAGQRRAAFQQEARAIVELVSEALAGAYPYRARLGEGLDRVVLFQGEAEDVRFVTTAPPLSLETGQAPFHAVTLGRTDSGALRLVERLVPATEPFAEGTETVLSRSVMTLRLTYLDDAGAWQDRWDGRLAAGLPRAVRVELTLRTGAGSTVVPPVVVAIPLGKEAA